MMKFMAKKTQTPTPPPAPAPNVPAPTPFDSTLAFAFRSIGGKQTAIEACRILADDGLDPYKRIVFAWDSASETDREEVRLEDLCKAAEIAPHKFIGDVAGALFHRKNDIAKLMIAANHDRIVEAAINTAASPSSFTHNDRRMMLEQSGLIAAKGPSIAVTQTNTQQVALQVKNTIGIKGGLPSFEEESIASATLIRGDAGTNAIGDASRKLLGEAQEHERIPNGLGDAGKEVHPIEAEFEDVQPEAHNEQDS